MDLELNLPKEIVICLDAQVSPAILASIFNVNVSYLYQEAQKGRLPAGVKGTYRECIQMYLQYFKNNQDVKLQQLEHAKELKELKAQKSARGEGMDALMEQKLQQEIRNGKAKETDTWLDIAIKRNKVINVTEFVALLEPFVLALRDGYLNIQHEFPETKEMIDKTLESFTMFGEAISQKASSDQQEFINTMLNKPINIKEVYLGLNELS